MNCKKKSLNNFISHLSWLRKLSLNHKQPLISICEFSKPYKWGGMGHEGVGLGHTGVGLCEVGWVMLRWSGSCRGGMGHTGVGWGGSCSKTT